MADKSKNNLTSEKEIRVHEKALDASFANFFAVEATEDDVTIGFGQRINVNAEKPVFEVRRRVSMTYKGAETLHRLLNELLKSKK